MAASIRYAKYLTVAMIFMIVYLIFKILTKYLEGNDPEITISSLEDDHSFTKQNQRNFSDVKKVTILDWTGHFGKLINSEIRLYYIYYIVLVYLFSSGINGQQVEYKLRGVFYRFF